ncbi:Uncharacterised protein [Candidatus Ornithobacterium hominis]|uniref:hypothetical protein n=1 Tax=Candidatus Ornithobacterium hominis TaxID=2497989 RepID=UPI000E5BB286|nr:hypothetical protein [Candidatus Ornithobacterium hominis]SZD72741.1 Uncharacterised protein [Candidatus Ornithobacterium hominis]
MQHKEINNKSIKLYGNEKEDTFIGVAFNSQELDLENPFFENNGLEKVVTATKIIVDLENNQIFTEKRTHSLTPTGDKVNITTNPVFITTDDDTALFLSQAKDLIIPAIHKGILMDMGLIEDKRKKAPEEVQDFTEPTEEEAKDIIE